MPLMRCKIGGMSGWKFGQSGKCYTGKNAKSKAVKQALAIGKGKIPIDHIDSQQSKETFKQILLQSRISKRRKLKNKKPLTWLIPSQYERAYFKFLKTITNRFKNITTNLLPSIREWKNENKYLFSEDSNWDPKSSQDIIKDINSLLNLNRKDTWAEEVEQVKKQMYEELQNEIFKENEGNLKAELINFVVLISIFNKKQFNKINKNALNIEFDTLENWDNALTQAWVTRNVSLIKGLTDEYVKKITDAIISGIQKGLSIEDIRTQLVKINKDLVNRARLIARDQINKINSQLSKQRQLDAGITTYRWRNVGDRRVVGNPSGLYPVGNLAHGNHWIMEGLLCRWDDPTVYSNDNGKTWIKRTAAMPKAHPGEEIQCRCHAEPNYDPLVEEVNITMEDMLG